MLKIYLSSVAVWLILLYAGIAVCKKKMVENGWLSFTERPAKSEVREGYLVLIATACLPVFRLAILLSAFYCATNKKG